MNENTIFRYNARMKPNRSLGPCPACGGDVLAYDNFYGCARWRDGCDFTVSVSSLAGLGHAKLSPKQMRALLKAPTPLRFRMADGSTKLFWVALRFVEGRWRPWIDFSAGSERVRVGSCPRCGADVMAYPLSYGCSRWEEGCDFAVFKNCVKRFGGKMLAEKTVTALLRDGRVAVPTRDGSRAILTIGKEGALSINIEKGESDE
jgi:DNA topoisomerase-3